MEQWIASCAAKAAGSVTGFFAAEGIDPNRLTFLEFSEKKPSHLALYERVDLCLDTHPYNAGTTAGDALWAGLPVLTYAGDTFAGRVAASLLHATGLPELVAASPADYVAAAVALASDPGRLHALRQKLADPRRAGRPGFPPRTRGGWSPRTRRCTRAGSPGCHQNTS